MHNLNLSLMPTTRSGNSDASSS